MHFLKSVFACSAIAVALVTFAQASEDPSDVLVLSKADFSNIVKPEKLMLVEFYAPWCGHCKALAPEYEIAATELKADNIKLAKVDCTAEQDVCSDYGVKGYPTLKVFHEGVPSDYNGPRKADGIVSFMKKQALPALSESVDVDTFKDSDNVVIIGFLTEAHKQEYAALVSVSNQLREKLQFGVSSDAKAAKKYGVKIPSIVLFKKFDDGQVNFMGEVTAEGLLGWVKGNSLPLVNELGPDNFNDYMEAGLPLAYIFVASDSEKNEFVKSVGPIAKSYLGQMNFVTIDAVKYGQHSKNLNLKEGEWPAFAIQQPASGAKYPMDQGEKLTAAAIESFVAKFLKGEVPQSIKSEPIPTSQDNPVYVVVADAFEDVVYDSTKDVLLEIYAPWCGHCKKLAPIYEELASSLRKNPNLIIAKMDGTENDLPSRVPFKITGFPALKFFKAAKKGEEKEIINYEGNRTLESLIEFLKEHSSSELVVEEPEKEEEEDEEGVKHDEL